MALDCHVDYLIEKLGHDGSEILWPGLPEPFRRRGHHIEEIQYVAFGMFRLLVPFVPAFEYNPGATDTLPFAQYNFSPQFESMLKMYDGILVGHWKRGHPHAVAWSAKEGLLYDPEGDIHDSIGAFEPEQLYAAIRRA